MVKLGRGRVERLPLPVARGLARTPLLSADEQIAVAERSARFHLERGELDKAEESARAAMVHEDRPRKVADLLHEVASEIVAQGREPALLVDAVRAQLRVADLQLSRRRTTPAAESFARAVGLAFDRGLHFDSTSSPLARDPRAFTAPLRDSELARALRAPRGRSASTPPTPDQGPVRVLVATSGNAYFLGDLLALLDEHPAVKPQYVDFGDNRKLTRGIFRTPVVAEEILTGRHGKHGKHGKPGMARRAEEVLRPYLDETDTLFVEWCGPLAVLVGLVDPRDTRVMVRLHSYEAFTRWPHLLDFSRVDDLVFVSEHLRDLAVDVVPALTESDAPRLHVLPLSLDLEAYTGPKDDAARFNLALVGWGTVAKDPLWAFEVVRRLREYDERYRLLLVGNEFAGDTSAAASRYAEQVSRELGELESTGVVRRLGPSDDVPAVLTEVGAILSSSVRESFHAALVEGAASGAVPVVRDWPFFAGRPTGARTLFPDDWVVSTPEEAARRILDTTLDADVWRTTGAAASAHALASWDWEVVKPRYEELFLS